MVQGDGDEESEGKRRTITFDPDVEKIIEAHRKSKSPIPQISEAVNDLIRAADKGDRHAK